MTSFMWEHCARDFGFREENVEKFGGAAARQGV
jgi:hypothetical protein